MKDNVLRGIILQKFYDKRQEPLLQWTEEDFVNMGGGKDFTKADLWRICDQLSEHGLTNWKSFRSAVHGTVGGIGQISAYGVDVIEGEIKSPIAITLDQSQHISISQASNFQIGSSNIQNVTILLTELLTAIDNAQASEDEKREAKSRLQKFLEHPIVASILGGLASNLK